MFGPILHVIGIGPLIIFDRRLNLAEYIDILEKHLPTALQKFPSQQFQKVRHQQDNAGSHVSAKTQEYFEKKRLPQISCPASNSDLNIIDNIWSILDDKLLQTSINNTDELKNPLQTA